MEHYCKHAGLYSWPVKNGEHGCGRLPVAMTEGRSYPLTPRPSVSFPSPLCGRESRLYDLIKGRGYQADSEVFQKHARPARESRVVSQPYLKKRQPVKVLVPPLVWIFWKQRKLNDFYHLSIMLETQCPQGKKQKWGSHFTRLRSWTEIEFQPYQKWSQNSLTQRIISKAVSQHGAWYTTKPTVCGSIVQSGRPMQKQHECRSI